MREGDLSRARQRVDREDFMSPISTALKGGVTDMPAVQAEARILLQAPGAVLATSLRVAGATGRNEKEARDTCTWDIQSEKLKRANSCGRLGSV